MSKNSDSQMTFTKDSHGKDVLLKDNSLQVMMEWEKPYMEACIDTLQPKGDVLEIGFGLGYSASRIQHYKPKSHTIIECDETVLKAAEKWAKSHLNVRLVKGMWQDQLKNLGQFDSIFFDDYSPFKPEEITEMKKATQEMENLKTQAEDVRKGISKVLEKSKGIKFSENDLMTFGKSLESRPNVTEKDVHSFLDNLEKWGNISKDQKARFLKDFGKSFGQTNDQKEKESIIPSADRFIAFAAECLDKHMKPGSRLSAFVESPESKKNNPEFKKHILSRSDVNYSEKTMPISVPENCKYYQGNSALIIVIEKKKS